MWEGTSRPAATALGQPWRNAQRPLPRESALNSWRNDSQQWKPASRNGSIAWSACCCSWPKRSSHRDDLRPRLYRGDVQVMTQVSVSHLRQHLPAYLKRVQEGEPIQITSRGRVIARLEAEHDPAQAARQWLEELNGRVTLVDVVSPLEPDLADAAWSGDADHL